jgi:hypothetical protein
MTRAMAAGTFLLFALLVLLLDGCAGTIEAGDPQRDRDSPDLVRLWIEPGRGGDPDALVCRYTPPRELPPGALTAVAVTAEATHQADGAFLDESPGGTAAVLHLRADEYPAHVHVELELATMGRVSYELDVASPASKALALPLSFWTVELSSATGGLAQLAYPVDRGSFRGVLEVEADQPLTVFVPAPAGTPAGELMLPVSQPFALDGPGDYVIDEDGLRRRSSPIPNGTNPATTSPIANVIGRLDSR